MVKILSVTDNSCMVKVLTELGLKLGDYRCLKAPFSVYLLLDTCVTIETWNIISTIILLVHKPILW